MDEKEDKTVLTIEEANTKVLNIVNNAVVYGWDKEFCKAEVRKLVEQTKVELKELGASDELVLNTINSIMTTFMKSWVISIEVLKKEAKNDYFGAIGQTILNMESKATKETTDRGFMINVEGEKALIGRGSITNLRDFITGDSRGGSQRFIEYTDRIKQTLVEINERLADNTLTLVGKDGRQLSVRNLAEIETRYNMISEDLQRNGVQVNDFVIASAHSDASERCSWWQGKIFIVDLEVNSRPMGQYQGHKPQQTELGHIDGKPYYSLLEACNNGFLSYNCQHRLIKYYKGAQPPQYDDMVTVRNKRELTTIQRNMENTIRKYKRRETLSTKGVTIKRKNPYTDKMEEFQEREYNIMMSKYWQEKYSTLCKDNGLPEYRWRLKITQAEREVKQ